MKRRVPNAASSKKTADVNLAQRNNLSNRMKGDAIDHRGQHSPTEAQIARRAYEMYVAHGSTNGNDIGDWLAAERELSEAYSLPSQKARAVVAGQLSDLVAEADSKHDSPAHHDRINPSRELYDDAHAR